MYDVLNFIQDKRAVYLDETDAGRSQSFIELVNRKKDKLLSGELKVDGGGMQEEVKMIMK